MKRKECCLHLYFLGRSQQPPTFATISDPCYTAARLGSSKHWKRYCQSSHRVISRRYFRPQSNPQPIASAFYLSIRMYFLSVASATRKATIRNALSSPDDHIDHKRNEEKRDCPKKGRLNLAHMVASAFRTGINTLVIRLDIWRQHRRCFRKMLLLDHNGIPGLSSLRMTQLSGPGRHEFHQRIDVRGQQRELAIICRLVSPV